MSKLPKGWEYPKLEEIFEILKGNGLSKGKIVDNGKYKCVLYGELYTTYAEVINKVISSTNEEIGVKSKKGDILLPASTTTKGEDLANAVALNEENVLLGGDINIFRMKKNNVDSIFMAHYLTHIKKKDIANLTQGSTIIHLYGKNIKHLQVHLPPLEEQKKIADILTTVDKKIAFVEENISATEELKKGLMQKLLTEGIGHTEFKDSELGRIPESWEIKSLNQISDLTSSKRIYLSDYVDSGIPFFRGKEVSLLKNREKIEDLLFISENKYEEIKVKYGVPSKNDILITAVGTLANTYRVPNNDKFYFKDGNLIWLKDITENSIFIEYLMNFRKKDILDSASGSSQKALTIVQLKKLNLTLPPLEEQKQIAEILSTVDNKLENLKEKKLFFEELKKGLMQKLLTGEVRV